MKIMSLKAVLLLAGVVTAAAVSFGVMQVVSVTDAEDSLEVDRVEIVDCTDPDEADEVECRPSEAGASPSPTADEDEPGEISGNCDEAEHANDPECSGLAVFPVVPSPSPSVSPTDDDTDEISGPCDEDEHATDPECTGGAREDNSGPSENSGPGNADDDGKDNSGPGSSSSGSGSGGGDDHSVSHEGDD